MPTIPKHAESPSPPHTCPTNPCSGGTFPYPTRFPATTPFPTGSHGHLRGPSSPQPQLLTPHSLTTRDRDSPTGLPTPHPPTHAPSPLPRPRFPPGSRRAFPNLPSRHSTPPNTFTPPQQAPRLQPRGPARACGADTPSAAPHVCPGPGAPAVMGASGRGV